MKTFVPPGSLSRLKQAFAGLSQDSSGLAAVEFAVILPLMLVLFFGVAELSSGIAVGRKITMVAQSLSDLTSRSTSVDDTEIANFKTIGGAMLTPYAATPLKVTISELWIKPDTGHARVQWSSDVTKRPIRSEVAIPPDLIAKDPSNNIIANQYLIFSEVSYLYTPAVGYVMGKAGVTLSDVSYTRPRIQSCVYYSESSCPQK
jgi:Flp pilus assembly protein TadG